MTADSIYPSFLPELAQKRGNLVPEILAFDVPGTKGSLSAMEEESHRMERTL
jgi:hypothetical protein